MKTRLQVKLAFGFTPRWDSTDFCRAAEKLLCFIQECREAWGDVAW